MYTYFLIFWTLAALAYLVRERAHSQVLVAVAGVFLVFFAGTRVAVGCDYWGYFNRFTAGFPGMNWFDALRMNEGLFQLLTFLVWDSGAPYSRLILICSVIYVACLARFANLAQRPLAFLALSFPILVLQLGMSGLRQALALGFVMLALTCFVGEGRALVRRRVLFVFWVVVASQFHQSAIIFLPIAFLIGRTISPKRLILALLLFTPVVLFLLQSRLEVYSDRYVEQIYGENAAGGAWLRYLLALIPFLVFQWKRRVVTEEHPRLAELLRLFAFITVALFPIGLVSSVALHRLVFYVMPVSILALLCISEAIFKRDSRRVGAAIPFIAYGAYITVWFMTSRHATMCYVPYQSWML